MNIRSAYHERLTLEHKRLLSRQNTHFKLVIVWVSFKLGFRYNNSFFSNFEDMEPQDDFLK